MDPDPSLFWTDPDPSIIKTFISTVLWLLCGILLLNNDENVCSKSNKQKTRNKNYFFLQKVISKKLVTKIFFLASWRSLTGSPDPDPYQNVTDPQHRCNYRDSQHWFIPQGSARYGSVHPARSRCFGSDINTSHRQKNQAKTGLWKYNLFPLIIFQLIRRFKTILNFFGFKVRAPGSGKKRRPGSTRQ